MLRLRVIRAGHCLKQSLRVMSACKSSVAGVDYTAELTEANTIPFARAKLGYFYQIQPKLGNQFTEDVTLRSFLKRHMSDAVYNAVSPDLEKFGERVAGELFNLSRECEKNPPKLEQFNAWGERIDGIITSEAWNKMKTVAAEEGLISIAYERKYEEFSRLYQVAKLYLYSSSSGLYSCPLAMTDGAAKSLELLNNPGLMNQAYSHLISRDPQTFWTSGQWMTERRGGSDVARGTETLAIPETDGTYRLYGYKWFTSATDSDMALTLARIVDPQGQTTSGTHGLSMFYLETRDSNGKLNNIEVQRLKDKLGTRQLPTAELLLDGTKAYLVSEEGRGVASISTMLTMTRLHNALSSAAGMRRAVNLARDYTTKRECFGKVIKDHSIHIKTIANMEVETRGATIFTLELARLLGLQECWKSTDREQEIFRLLTPVLKLYTAKQAVATASEGLECFGGAGYLEDTGLPVLLRDAQVLPIWEGTTNILSLDVLRALAKSNGKALLSFHQDIHERLAPAMSNLHLKNSAEKITRAVDSLVEFASSHVDKLEAGCRDFAYSLARTYTGMLLVEHALWAEATEQDILAAQRWAEKDLTPVITEYMHGNLEMSCRDAEFKLVFDGYVPTPGSKL